MLTVLRDEGAWLEAMMRLWGLVLQRLRSLGCWWLLMAVLALGH